MGQGAEDMDMEWARQADPHPCTCHPDDNPPRPCPRKYALTECRQAHDAALLDEAVEVLREITALDDTAECCGHGVCGGYSPPECCGQPLYGLDRAKNAARAFLSKLENRHDR